MYVTRLITDYILKASRTFPVVLLTGPRQSGKTTLLTKIKEPKRTFVSLDDIMLRELALSDPRLFFQRFKPPVFIDEIQYAPNLLPYIKIFVDEKATQLKSANGLFWLSGSQNFALMSNISESLAGRVAIMNLLGFSRYEYTQGAISQKTKPFFMDKENLFAKGLKINELFKVIIRGSMPKPIVDSRIDIEQFYSSYMQTYIERDIRQEIGAKSLRVFGIFIRLLAARAAQLLNMDSLSREAGVALNTVKAWVSLLEKTFQIYILRPYHSNINKRETKTPKIYFLDTGLLCYLTRWNDAITTSIGPMAGGIFENWVISELVKSYWHRGKEAPFYFYRTRDAEEIDLFSVQANQIIACEIKLSAMPDTRQFLKLAKRLKDKKINIKKCWALSLAENMLPQDADTIIFPASNIY